MAEKGTFEVMEGQYDFEIANRVRVSFQTNELYPMTEENMSAKIKVEPRIMQVLEILIKNSPNVVSREQLIDEVWDNYGGADDALNQAISHLRKSLGDTDKDNRLIETVVKKGYRFTGSITSHEGAPTVRRSGVNSKVLWAVVLGAAIAITTVILYFTVFTKEPIAPLPDGDRPSHNSSTAPVPESD